jgi:ring-1,2-phenylacetyl-CoA epoxidase subunit PaaD
MLPATHPVAEPRPERGASRCERAWTVLESVLDPEVPALSIVDLGIVRDVVENDGVLELMLTPTYSGCPATEVIEADALAAIGAAGLGPARVVMRRAPAWTTEWISDDGKRKLREYGIAPPAHFAAGDPRPIRFIPRHAIAPPACPHCGSTHTERLSAFGATACKSLHRCLDCREPFEHFKAI